MRANTRNWHHRALGRGWMYLMTGGVALVGAASGACAHKAVIAPPQIGASVTQGKLSADVRLWARGERGESAAVLIRTDHPVTGADQRALQAAGVKHIGISGDVAAGFVRREALERVAALSFVVYVELSRPLPAAARGVP